VVPLTMASCEVPAMLTVTDAPAATVPVILAPCSPMLMPLSMAMSLMAIALLPSDSRSETTAGRALAPLPPVRPATTLPASSASATLALSPAPMPLPARPATTLSMVACMVPLAASTPDSAARIAPYFSPALRLSGV
jgi:hypothetical protein